jgi:hypothetical protein
VPPQQRRAKKVRLGAAFAFEGFSFKEVALFLRLVFYVEDATPNNLAQVKGCLPAVARLAHKFDIRSLLAAVEESLLQLEQTAVLMSLPSCSWLKSTSC